MPKNNDSKGVIVTLGDYIDQPNPGLRSYFGKVREGQPDEYRTTFASGTPVSKVLEEWEPTLMTIADKWPSLVNFENDLRAKVGPMSIMKPLKDRIEDIDHYYDDVEVDASPISDRAIKATISEFSAARGTQIRGQQSTVRNMKLSTNSGTPFFTKRRNVVNKTIPVSCESYPNLFYLKGVEWNYSAILGWRGQEGGPSETDVKQRVVWMFPFGINIAELQAYQPLIEQFQMHNLTPSWVSMEAVDRRITDMFQSKGSDDIVVCTDFTRFDQHFNSHLQIAAKQLLAALLNDDKSSKSWLEDVFPIKYNIPLMYDYGRVRFGSHGMGSGSGGTNFDETIVHRSLQYEAAQSSGAMLNINSQCLGDDGVITYPGITVDAVVDSYSRHGLEMNQDKQYASKDDCTYLRRWHHKAYTYKDVCVGVYSTYRAIGRLCEQERFYDPESWGKEQVALRQLSILENVKWHPLRKEFVQFCMKRDKYRLGIDIPGFFENIERIARESNENMPDFLGYTKANMSENKGISSWWVVNYLKGLKS